MTPTDAWTPSPGITLEPNAELAVRELSQCTAIAAGPGAGKTELLAQRASFLFQVGGCPHPQRIIAISFKVDAARNLRERVAERCDAGMTRRFDSYTFHAFARTIIARHRALLADRVPSNFTVGPHRSPTQLAYDDLLPLALQVLETDARAIAILRQTYAFAFFDEFQDCTSQQFELIERIFAGSDSPTTAVGDSKQSIMGWAGALDDAMSDYLSKFSAAELPIYQNHRSLKRLRRVQNAVIKVMSSDAALPDDELASSTASELASDGEVQVLSFPNASVEATTVARLILRDIQQGTPPSEIALLTGKQPTLVCEELVHLLADKGVSVRDEQGAQDAFGQPVGQLILDVARLITVGRSPDEYSRVGQFMTRYCVDEQQADRRRRKFEVFLRTTRRALANDELNLSDPEAFKALLYAFLKLCERQFLSRLSVEYEDERALTSAANAAIDVINEAISQSDTPQSGMAKLSADDAVRLLTVHKSKGLEFDHVYFLAIEAEMFWGSPDAERATFFVGISRARKKLILTHVQQRLPLTPPYPWDVDRRPHPEFLRYAYPECS